MNLSFRVIFTDSEYIYLDMHMFEYWGFKCMQIICFFVDDDIGGGVRGVFVSVTVSVLVIEFGLAIV